MFTYDLCSVVFVLRPERMFSAHYRFLGRMVHKLFLLMLAQSGEGALADELHDLNAALPYTVSDLFPNGGEHYWMRVTGLNARLCSALHHLVEMLPGRVLEMPSRDSLDDVTWRVGVEAAVSSQHEWAGQRTYAELVRPTSSLSGNHLLTLDFMTPTTLKSIGTYRPFPEPTLIFRLLYERLSKIQDIVLPFRPESAFFEAFTEHLMEIDDYQIECGRIPVKKDQVTAFYGLITYRLLANNEAFKKRAETHRKRDGDGKLVAVYEDVMQRRDDYTRLVHVLADFAFYSGVGMYTGQGMGMMRKVRRIEA